MQKDVCMCVCVCVCDLAPLYICELVQLKQSDCRLQEDNPSLLKIPKTRLKSYGDAAFSVTEPNTWDHLEKKKHESCFDCRTFQI